jgi:hypothetical protein
VQQRIARGVRENNCRTCSGVLGRNSGWRVTRLPAASHIFADLTNSGRQDLFVVRHSGPLLFINLGNGTFQVKPDTFHFARPPQGTFTGVALADYDRDGLLDVYFCTYSFNQGLSDYGFPKPYYDAQNGPPNFLLKNSGGHAFKDVTTEAGLDVSNNRFSFAGVWNDYDRDGWPDLYVVNDFGRKVLYKNNRNGTFTDVSAEAGVEDPGEGMSATWFDYDNDGYDDIYAVIHCCGRSVEQSNTGHIRYIEEGTVSAVAVEAVGQPGRLTNINVIVAVAVKIAHGNAIVP